MRSKALWLGVSAACFAAAAATTYADDGEQLIKQVSSPPGIEESPEPEGEHAYIKMMNFYVPAQEANGELTEIEYIDADGTLRYTLEKAKPLVSFYIYGPVITFDDFSQSGFPGHGRRDAFAAVSLDDGNTWKRTNLSRSADDSSFTVSTPIPDPGVEQPGFDVDADSPVITNATYIARRGGGYLSISGVDAPSVVEVTIRNAVTKDVIATVMSRSNGSFTTRISNIAEVPCTVQAGVDGEFGPVAEVAGVDETCVGSPEVTTTDQYPGDVTNGTHAAAGNRVLAAWQSKYCRAGTPVWSAEYPRDEVALYLGIDNLVDFYLTDLFAVAGSQDSVDYREQAEFPGEYDGVGEVPYNCLWSARGVLREDPENLGTTEGAWFTAERLTSGRRDVNRIEVSCTDGAGCAVTWQEDPEGLRPGEGEGAGTGWAGATTNSQTEVWYSFVRWEDFDIVDDNGEPLPLADNTLDTGRPKPYVPMMAAARLTNNARCPFPVINRGDYCDNDFAAPYLIKDQCIDQVEIPLGPAGELLPVCVVDSNGSGVGDTGDMVNIANTASSRPRLSLQPRDSDGDGVTDDAWVLVFAEEDKGLGRFGFPDNVEWDVGNLDDTAVSCGDPDASIDDDCLEADIGKNIWWFSFAMGTPKTSVALSNGEVDATTVDFSLVNNVLVQANMMNQPEVNWRTGTFFPPMPTAEMWDFGDTYNYDIFNTEIARRSSMMAQSLAKATTNATAGLVAFPLWKQGIVRQGGPADIMARRIVTPLDIDQTTTNPYDFANLACEYTDDAGNVVEGVMLYDDGLNPYYPKGLCMAPAINLSARTPYECDAAQSGGADGVCPGLAMECEEVTGYGQLCSADDPIVSRDSLESPENLAVFDKLLSWYECPGANGVYSGTRTDLPACFTDDLSTILGWNLNDQSWYMPLEISKAHRGFLDGDFVMNMYAWSPNYKDNRVGRDRYELYTRRSFDGGLTWTTTPSSGLASDGITPYEGAGTTTCETLRDGEDSLTDNHICTTYAAAELEQSRNMSQIRSNRTTTLDPRFTPTIASMPTEGDLEWAIYEPLDPTDIRNPSRYFIIYEDGDNTTTALGEAEPLNLAYSRGVVFGDHYQVWAEDEPTLTLDVCYPNDPHGDDFVSWATGLGFCNEFDELEGKPLDRSEEASVTASAYGDFLYGIWGQFTVDEEHEFVEGDAIFRRVWYLDDFIPADAWEPGQGQLP